MRPSLQTGEWVTSLDFKNAYLHIPIQSQSRKYLRFHVQGQTYQFKALPFVYSTRGVHFSDQRGQTDGFTEGYKDPPVPRQLVGLAQIPPNLSPAYTDTSSYLSGWLVNMEKSELDPEQTFDFIIYQFALKEGKDRLPQERWQTLTAKIQELLAGPTCPVRQLMSLILILSATEKQFHLGRLHIRPIEWQLKNNWRVTESLEKMIPIPRSLHLYLKWWLGENNLLQGQPLHPLKHDQQIFTDASKESWGTHLNKRTARGTWSLLESKLHINCLELKAVFLALKEFQDHYENNIVLIATDNTTLVAYIDEGG